MEGQGALEEHLAPLGIREAGEEEGQHPVQHQTGGQVGALPLELGGHGLPLRQGKGVVQQEEGGGVGVAQAVDEVHQLVRRLAPGEHPNIQTRAGELGAKGGNGVGVGKDVGSGGGHPRMEEVGVGGVAGDLLHLEGQMAQQILYHLRGGVVALGPAANELPGAALGAVLVLVGVAGKAVVDVLQGAALAALSGAQVEEVGVLVVEEAIELVTLRGLLEHMAFRGNGDVLLGHQLHVVVGHAEALLLQKLINLVKHGAGGILLLELVKLVAVAGLQTLRLPLHRR